MRKWLRTFGVVILLGSFFLARELQSVSVDPNLKERLLKSKQWEDFVKRELGCEPIDTETPGIYKLRPSTVARQTVDTLRVLVLLVDFPDFLYTAGSVAVAPAYFDTLFNSVGVMNTGSFREFYLENSYSRVVVVADVYGWFTVSQNYSYYTNGQSGLPGRTPYPNNAKRMVEEAIELADSLVDFSLYDNDGNGTIEAPFVVHAGPGDEQIGSGDNIWSHASNITPQVRDGVTISRYSTEPEEFVEGGGNVPISVGVFCHESGHSLYGLPDLYDRDNSSEGLGNWDLMAAGNWGRSGSGKHPAHYGPWEKERIGFATSTVISANQNGVAIPEVENTGIFYKVWTNGLPGQQYFLVENRQPVALFDTDLPGYGLLVYHVDNTVTTQNDNENHYLVALEQADGFRDLESNRNRGDDGDPWPGSANKRNFDEFSNPNSKDYNNSVTQVAVFNISNSDTLMSANIEVTYGRPYITFDSYSIDDATFGNNNGRPDSAETVEFFATVRNAWLATSAVHLVLRTADSLVTILDSIGTTGPVGTGGTGTNSGDPIVFSASVNMPAVKSVYFTLLGYSDDSVSTFSQNLKINFGPNNILLVDDDSGATYESFYGAALDSLATVFSSHSVLTAGVPDSVLLAGYPKVIWFTGRHRIPELSSQSVQMLKNYLDGGGKLFLTGQSIAEALAASPDSSFLLDYLRVRYAGNTNTVFANGVTGDPITGGVKVAINVSDGASNQTSMDYLTSNGALPIFTYQSNNQPAGSRFYIGNYAVVFLGFGFEAISSTRSAQGYATRKDVMKKVLDWLNAPTLSFTRGEVTGNGVIDLVDIIYLINYVFNSGPPPQPISAAGDVNCDTNIDIVDIQFLINNVFFGEPLPC